AESAIGGATRPSLEMAPLELESPIRSSGSMDAIELEDEEESEGEDEDLATIPTPPAARRQSTVIAAQDVDLLRALSDADPDDNVVRRRLAEAMLESRAREGGLRDLAAAMLGFERA